MHNKYSVYKRLLLAEPLKLCCSFLAVTSRYNSLIDLTLLLFVAETTTLKISYIFPNGDKYGELVVSF